VRKFIVITEQITERDYLVDAPSEQIAALNAVKPGKVKGKRMLSELGWKQRSVAVHTVDADENHDGAICPWCVAQRAKDALAGGERLRSHPDFIAGMERIHESGETLTRGEQP